MIGRLQGILLDRTDSGVVLDVGGVGYEVEVPDSLLLQLPDIGKNLLLHTHFIVREDAQQLFGFIDLRDRSLFRLLLKVNGVGPRMALGLLSAMDTDAFVGCVRRNDINALVKLPGVGRKTAERLLMEMKDRLVHWEFIVPEELDMKSGKAGGTHAAQQEAETALVSLGYKPQEASRALGHAESQLAAVEKVPDTENLIRLALKFLGKSAG